MRDRLLTTSVIALSALVLTGCGSGDSTPAAANASVTPESTPAASAAADPANGATDSSNVLAAVAAASSAAKTAKATITTSGAAQGVVGEGSFAFGSDPKASYTVTVATDGTKQQIGLILIDQAIYLKLGDLGQPKGGKPWVKISPKGTDALSKSFAQLGETLTQAGDVASSIRLLEAGATVKALGDEAVDGVPATKYLITTDVAKALASATGATKVGLQQLKDNGVTTVNATLWVDAKNLPVQYEQTSTIKGQKATTTVRYRAWGEPVSIQAPAASQVGSLSDLFGG